MQRGTVLQLQHVLDLVGTEKVAEQHIFTKWSKCTGFGVISNLLKVSTSPITQLAINLDLQKQQKYKGHKKLNKK